MAISVTDYLGIDKSKFNSTGALDSVLDFDTKMYIDIALLKQCSISEFKDAYKKVTQRFENILLLLEHSTRQDDKFWRAAKQQLHFNERPGVCLGLSKYGTRGRGFGEKLENQLLSDAKIIISAGIKDTRIFELMPLFEENIGPDRLSDMVVSIIYEELVAYSKNIFSKFLFTSDLDPKTQLPINPYNKFPIIFVPKSILQDIPLAWSWDDIDRVQHENEEIKRSFNETIGYTWKKATSSRVGKSDLRYYILNYPGFLIDLLSKYETKTPSEYDFTKDRSGQIIWYESAKKIADDYPLKLHWSQNISSEDIYNTVKTICLHFKDLVENNKLYSLLYNDNGSAKHESAAQLIFYGIADAYCKTNDIDLNREANAGRGPVDFKFSKGYDFRILVEVKKTSNNDLVHGIEIQVGEYEKSEKTKRSIYLVIDGDWNGAEKNKKALNKFIERMKKDNITIPEIVYVDAREKEAASTYKKARK